jgi:hypothetical protein
MSFLNLRHDRQPGGADGSQAWVASITTTPGRTASLSPGQPVGGACSATAFDNPSPGPDPGVP